MTDFECLWPLTMTLGESPLWDHHRQRLFWVDISGAQIHQLDPERHAHKVMQLDEAVGCIARHVHGGFIAGMRSGIWQLDDNGGKRACLAANPDNPADHRFNDGRCDATGRLWLGTMDEAAHTADAHLYAFDGRQLRMHKGGITISNGVAFSPDGRWLYHADTPRRIIYRHAYDTTSGSPGSGEPWVDLNAHAIAGNPDGAAVDSDGCYWCALYDGGTVIRIAPDGHILERYRLPAPKPTMPAFGGPDLRTLYVTTAREHMTAHDLERWPESGSLFAMRVDTPGRLEPCFTPATD